jgi:voltage-gated potassium channel
MTVGMRIASAMVRPHVVTFLEEMLRAEGNYRIEEMLSCSGSSMHNTRS